MNRRFLLVALSVFLAVGCRPDDAEEVAGADLLEMDADQVMLGMDHFVTRDGLLRARLQADTAFTFEDAAEIRLRGVDIKFFDETGNEISALNGRRGIYHTGSRDMEMMEDIVVLDRRESRRLETEELFYDAAGNRLSSDVEFVLYRGNTVVRGTGFVSDPALDTVEVTQPSGVSEGMMAPGGGMPTTEEGADEEEPPAVDGGGEVQDTSSVPTPPPDSTAAPDTTAAQADSAVVQDTTATRTVSPTTQDTARPQPDSTSARDAGVSGRSMS